MTARWLRLGVLGLILLSLGPAFAQTTISSSSTPVIDRVTANTTVGNTGVETTIYTKSIPGGTLGTNVRLRLTLQCQVDTDLVVGGGATIRLKYGATTLATMTQLVNDGVTDYPPATAYILEFWLSGDGATNAQIGHARGTIQPASITTTNLIDALRQARGTSSEDSTLAKTLVITFQWGSAGVSNTITMEHAILEQL